MLDRELTKEKSWINLDTSGGPLLKITEKHDPTSPFYFIITYYDHSQGQMHSGWREEDEEVSTKTYECSYNPSSLESTHTTFILADLDEIPDHLQYWVELVKEYNKESTLFDDPILQGYYDDLEITFTVTDEDADYRAYPHETQGKLNTLYDQIKQIVESEKNSDNNDEANQIIRQIEAAQNNISKQTKREASKNLQKILALIKKYSYKAGELIAEGLMVDFAIKLITGG